MTRPRHDHAPNANSPQLLARLLELFAQGVRSTRGLQEALGVDPRTVQYYTQAGQWLALIEEDASTLTPLGVDFVYAGRQRPEVYAEAVWAQPLAAELLAGADGAVPHLDEVTAAVMAAEPGLAGATARRRASAVRALIAPAAGMPRRRVPHAQQLALPLAHAAAGSGPPRLVLGAGTEWNPDVYRYLLVALLDYGELGLGQVRALLDRGGADRIPIGGYVEMAIARGDANRRGEKIAVTDDAIARRDLVGSTASIVLSDPTYRAYLADAIAASGDRAAEIRRDQVAARFRPWDRRVFGHPLRPEHVAQDLERVLMDRSLASFSVARRVAPERVPVAEPFLDAWEEPHLIASCPPFLAQLQGGVAAVNAVLRRARQGATDVAVPDLGTRPVQVHGGILHPGEPLPRSVPDLRSLRLRVLMCAPYPALIAAILLLHRLRPERLDAVRARDGWEVRWQRRRIGALLSVCDRFGASRGWAMSRRPGGIDAAAVIGSLEALGIAWVSGRRAVLEERFFGQLRTSPEEVEVFEQLLPLATAVEDWLSSAPPEEDA